MAATIAMSCDALEFESSNVVSVRLVPEADVGVVFAIVLEIDQLVDTTADNLYFGHDDSSLAKILRLPNVVAAALFSTRRTRGCRVVPQFLPQGMAGRMHNMRM